MNCPLCKGTMKPGNTHVNQAVGNDGLIVLMHVPARKNEEKALER